MYANSKNPKVGSPADVWRSTNHGDGAADVSSNCQRHQFLGSRDFSCLADADDNWHQARNSTGVGGNGRQDDRNEHYSAHQTGLSCARLLNDCDADCFSKASLEHSSADNEHAAEEYDCGV